MGLWKGFVWAVGRNTEWGRKQLGQETLREQGVREQALRRRLEGRWFTKYREGDGTIELLIDPEGNLTDTYPHLHVIHDERAGEVRFVASTSNRQRVYTSTLPGDVSGNEVNAEIDRALRELRRYS